MIYNNVILTVRDRADIDAVARLLQQQAELSRHEPGCARFEVYHSDSDPSVFLLIEQWEDQPALNAHREARAFTQVYRPLVLPLVERSPHLCTLLAD